MKNCGSIRSSSGQSQLRGSFFSGPSLRPSANCTSRRWINSSLLLILLAVCAGWFVLDNLQEGIGKVRRALDPADSDALIRGREILNLQQSILIATAVVVGWAVLFKLP